MVVIADKIQIRERRSYQRFLSLVEFMNAQPSLKEIVEAFHGELCRYRNEEENKLADESLALLKQDMGSTSSAIVRVIPVDKVQQLEIYLPWMKE